MARLQRQLRGHQDVQRGVPLGDEAGAGQEIVAAHAPPDRNLLARSGISIVISVSFPPSTRSKYSWG